MHQMQIKSYMLKNAVFRIFLLIFCFSLLKYTYYYNYRSHISLQVVKLAKSAGVQILIFPTVCLCVWVYLQTFCVLFYPATTVCVCVCACVYLCICVGFSRPQQW